MNELKLKWYQYITGFVWLMALLIRGFVIIGLYLLKNRKEMKEIKNYLKDNKLIKLEKGEYELTNFGKEGYRYEKVSS